jgi:hypothetical protein
MRSLTRPKYASGCSPPRILCRPLKSPQPAPCPCRWGGSPERTVGLRFRSGTESTSRGISRRSFHCRPQWPAPAGRASTRAQRPARERIPRVCEPLVSGDRCVTQIACHRHHKRQPASPLTVPVVGMDGDSVEEWPRGAATACRSRIVDRVGASERFIVGYLVARCYGLEYA